MRHRSDFLSVFHYIKKPVLAKSNFSTIYDISKLSKNPEQAKTGECNNQLKCPKVGIDLLICF